ncbi:hypothetical protein CBR_g46834 [Chara braunii]|uniref:Mitochondrial import inner membrane translocase subunit n=1 Tax=Chara braunii TaxID=69332 RepID=A0A388M117_CHABU|nr:hypothetical protein CBR_g46834 [Chara braunii]|eukprot:GBG88268.1 hypothetical protein CBR_g46834 [Chara braunii]
MDPSMLASLSDEDKAAMDKMLETVQMRDSLRLYNTLVERCFNNCVDSFRRKTLDKTEETCVKRCVEKFLKHTGRVSLRFQEINGGLATPD